MVKFRDLYELTEKVGLKFSADDEIMDLVTFNESEKCYYLNKFDRM